MTPRHDATSETDCLRCASLEARVVALEARVGVTPPGRSIDPDALYTVLEAADRLRCGRSNLYDLLETGELAVTRIGAGRMGLRVRGSDLIAFLDARRDGGPVDRGSSFRYLRL